MSETTVPLTSQEKIPSIEPPERVRIFIRSPAISSPNGFSIYATPKTSMLALKEAIAEHHPLKPQVTEQRLIYRGRVLDNSEIISKVLRDDLSTDQTFHLVVKPSFETGTESRSSSTSAQTIKPSFTCLRQRGTTNPSSPRTQMPVYPSQPFAVDASSQSTYPPFQNAELAQQQWMQYLLQQQHNAWWQQQNTLHSHLSPQSQTQTQPSQSPQFNNSYPTVINRQALPLGYPFHYYVMINGLPYVMPTPYIPQFPYPYPPLQHQNLQPPQQIIQPQQEAHEGGGRNRRRAATFWLLLKLGFLVYLFSQNASIERIILLNILALVIFLYQTGRLRIVRRRRYRGLHHGHNNIFVPQAPQIVPVIPNNQADLPPLGQPNAAAVAPSDTTSSSTQPSQASPEQNNISQATTGPTSSSNNGNPATTDEAPVPEAVVRQITLRDIEHGLYAFVASLIPTNVPDAVQQDDNMAL